MTMKDVAGQSSVQLSRDQVAEFDGLIRDFVDIVADPVYYKLTTLLALTRAPSDGSSNPLAPLKSYYELLLRRRTEWMFRRGTGKLFLNVPDSESLVSRVFSCIKNMERLAEILMYIKNQS